MAVISIIPTESVIINQSTYIPCRAGYQNSLLDLFLVLSPNKNSIEFFKKIKSIR